MVIKCAPTTCYPHSKNDDSGWATLLGAKGSLGSVKFHAATSSMPGVKFVVSKSTCAF